MSKTKKVRKPQPFNISNAGEIHFAIYFILKLDYHNPIYTPIWRKLPSETPVVFDSLGGKRNDHGRKYDLWQ